MDVTPQECENAWWEVVRGCDGNDPTHNPGNLKHGGTYDFRGGKDLGAVLEFIPQLGQDQKICTPLSTDFWIDRDTMRIAARAFCSLAASSVGSSPLHFEIQNNPDPIKFSVYWEEGAVRSNSECNRAFETLNVGYVGSNPTTLKEESISSSKAKARSSLHFFQTHRFTAGVALAQMTQQSIGEPIEQVMAPQLTRKRCKII
jgi:hypothetical protein